MKLEKDDLDLFEEDLIKMMEEFWAVDNNSECAVTTLEFIRKYKIDNDKYHNLYNRILDTWEDQFDKEEIKRIKKIEEANK